MLNHYIRFSLNFYDQNSISVLGQIDSYTYLNKFQIDPIYSVDYLSLERTILICFKSILIEELANQLENYPTIISEVKLDRSMQIGFQQFHKLIQKIESFKNPDTSTNNQLWTGIQIFKCEEILSESINYSEPRFLKKCKELNEWLRYYKN